MHYCIIPSSKKRSSNENHTEICKEEKRLWQIGEDTTDRRQVPRNGINSNCKSRHCQANM